MTESTPTLIMACGAKMICPSTAAAPLNNPTSFNPSPHEAARSIKGNPFIPLEMSIRSNMRVDGQNTPTLCNPCGAKYTCVQGRKTRARFWEGSEQNTETGATQRALSWRAAAPENLSEVAWLVRPFIKSVTWPDSEDGGG